MFYLLVFRMQHEFLICGSWIFFWFGSDANIGNRSEFFSTEMFENVIFEKGNHGSIAFTLLELREVSPGCLCLACNE